MQADVSLVPAAEEDLPLLYRLTSDPKATGEHEWFGWQDPHAFRRRWEENGLLDETSGVLMVSVAGEKAFRGGAFQNGRWHDAVIYSVLRAEVDLDAG